MVFVVFVQYEYLVSCSLHILSLGQNRSLRQRPSFYRSTPSIFPWRLMYLVHHIVSCQHHQVVGSSPVTHFSSGRKRRRLRPTVQRRCNLDLSCTLQLPPPSGCCGTVARSPSPQVRSTAREAMACAYQAEHATATTFLQAYVPMLHSVRA